MTQSFSRKALPAALAALGVAFAASAQMVPTQSYGNANASPPGGTGATASASPANPPAARDEAAASRAPRSKLSHGDRKFIEEAAKGGMAEVELGKLAQQHAANDQVKQFASRMVTDHSKANEQLAQLAAQKGVTLPADAKGAEKREAGRLAKLQGADFDREYMKHMVKDHEKDVKAFEKEANKAKDNEVRDFASKTLPTLQDHLQLAQNADQAVRGTTKGAASR